MTLQTKLQATKHIQAYDLASFCQDVQQAFNEGFTFDFTRNEHWPTSFGAFYSATLVKEVVEAPTGVLASGGALSTNQATNIVGEVPSKSIIASSSEPMVKSAGRPKKG